MAVITSTSSKQQTVLEPCYRSRPLSPLSAYGFASSISSSFSATCSPNTCLPGNSVSTSLSSFSVRGRYEIFRSSTPSRSMTVKKPLADRDNSKNQSNTKNRGAAVAGTKKACLCSPSTHPGSFRCAMHRNSPRGGTSQSNSSGKTSSYHSSIRLNYLRSAMNNSLVRIGKGHMVKRDLAIPVKPSVRSLQRRVDHFQSKPSRLSVVSKTTSESY